VRLRRQFETRLPGGLIVTPQYESPGVRRPSKLAAGMSFTFSRSQHFARLAGRNKPQAQGDVLMLIVKGVAGDSRGLTWITHKQACPCCGNKQAGKLTLNEAGRARLRAMRRKAARRA
jgi:hypothetical protein